MMKLRVKLAIVAFSIGAAGIIGCSASDRSSLDVVGGTENYKSFPAVVGLSMSFEVKGIRQVCTGTFISPSRILTAAHCLRTKNLGPAISVTVLRNFSDGLDNSSSQYIGETTDMSVFPGFDVNRRISEWQQTDVAILKMKIDENNKVKTMSYSETAPSTGSILNLVGYGRTDVTSDGSNPQFKRHVATNEDYLMSQDQTRLLVLTGTVGVTTGGFSQGDSGGPAIIDGKVVGIASFLQHGSLAREDEVGNESVSKDDPLYSVYVPTFHPEVKEFIKKNL